MVEREHMLRREEAALAEVGRTDFSRGAARALAAVFVATVLAPAVVQSVRDVREHLVGRRASAWPQALDIAGSLPAAGKRFAEAEGSAFGRLLAANRLLQRDMDRYEDALEDESVLGKAVRPKVQALLAGWLGAGNEEAYVGREGWLFYRPGFDYVTRPGFLEARELHRRAASGSEWQRVPQPDPRMAILEFHEQLAARDVRLVVMPTPVKPVIEPERMAAAYEGGASAVQNPSYPRFVSDLERAGVWVFDPSEAMLGTRRGSGRPAYLATDTHWTPQAMEAAAQGLAAFIGDHVPLPPLPPTGQQSAAVEVENSGDIAVMLDLPESHSLLRPERVRVEQVRRRDGGLWRADTSADVLVLGDSFSNVYSLEAMGWGESAGLVERLSLALDRPVDRMVRNDAGAWATRALLARELERGRDRLAGKRVVVWQFAMRELAVGDWRRIPMRLGEGRPARFFVPEPGAERIVTGTVLEASPVPRPGTVPYKDHIMSVHLADLEDENGPIENGQAVVYMWSMRDNVWTPAARYRPGRHVRARLRPWADVEGRLGGVNRSDLDDAGLMLAEPCWAEGGEE